MKQLLIALLLTSTAYGQTNCTTVTKTTTGITIKNKGTYPAKYRIEVIGQADIVTSLLAVNAILAIPVIWCNDSLYVTANPTGSCSCKLDRIGIYNTCAALADHVATSIERYGNTFTYTITPLADNLGGFRIFYKTTGNWQSEWVPIDGHVVGVPFLKTIKF